MKSILNQIKTEFEQFYLFPLIKEWWWVGLVLIMTFAFHLHASIQKEQVVSSLKQSLSQLTLKKSELLKEKGDLELRIESQQDPEWIQMMLMKGLGVVPEGFRKVQFDDETYE